MIKLTIGTFTVHFPTRHHMSAFLDHHAWLERDHHLSLTGSLVEKEDIPESSAHPIFYYPHQKQFLERVLEHPLPGAISQQIPRV